MIDHTTALYCIIEDVLKAIGHRTDCHRELTDAEVITTAHVAAFYFGGNIEHSRRFISYIVKVVQNIVLAGRVTETIVPSKLIFTYFCLPTNLDIALYEDGF
jgi:hypothetical protein